MVELKKHNSYRDVEINTTKTTLAKSIERDLKIKSLQDNLDNLPVHGVESVSRKRTYKEECLFDEPQGPQ